MISLETHEAGKVSHKIKKEAYRKMASARRHGQLSDKPCELCGSKSNIHRHHHDYSKPLNVNFLCVDCHRKIHRILRIIDKADGKTTPRRSCRFARKAYPVEFMSVQEAAYKLGRDPLFVHRLIKYGRLPVYKLGSRSVIRIKDYDAFVKASEHPSPERNP